MDFFETVRTLVRRWKVVVPMLVLTGVLAFLAYTTSAANYQAKSSLLLVAPPAASGTVGEDGKPTTPCARNPFCGSGNLSNLGNVVARAMGDDTIAQEIVAQNPDGTYEVVLSPDDRSPIIEITATAGSPASALATLEDVTEATKRELARRQTDIQVPDDSLISSNPVTTARGAAVQAGGKTRAAIVALALGAGLTLAAALLAENRARRKARQAASGDAAAGSAIPSPVGPAPAPEPASPTVSPGAPLPLPARPRAAEAERREVAHGARRSGRFGS